MSKKYKPSSLLSQVKGDDQIITPWYKDDTKIVLAALRRIKTNKKLREKVRNYISAFDKMDRDEAWFYFIVVEVTLRDKTAEAVSQGCSAPSKTDVFHEVAELLGRKEGAIRKGYYRAKKNIQEKKYLPEIK